MVLGHSQQRALSSGCMLRGVGGGRIAQHAVKNRRAHGMMNREIGLRAHVCSGGARFEDRGHTLQFTLRYRHKSGLHAIAQTPPPGRDPGCATEEWRAGSDGTYIMAARRWDRPFWHFFLSVHPSPTWAALFIVFLQVQR